MSSVEPVILRLPRPRFRVRPCMPHVLEPAALAGRRLFEPIGALLAGLAGPGLPTPEQLGRLLGAVVPGTTSGGGRPIRFVAPGMPTAASGYEEHIFATGEVPTRADDWHDFFNALAWCVWPRTKTACNALHLDAQRARKVVGLAGRGPRRDALTQFDECGIVVVSADAGIPALLAAHRWQEAFWHRRNDLVATTRFLVFGHASWDQLRAPFPGLCAKAVYRTVGSDWLALPDAARQADTDAWLAAYLADPANIRAPRDLSPLPLLGIPGVTGDSEVAGYYRDPRQFRPKRERSAK